jgi:hypothetical protein
MTSIGLIIGKRRSALLELQPNVPYFCLYKK